MSTGVYAAGTGKKLEETRHGGTLLHLLPVDIHKHISRRYQSTSSNHVRLCMCVCACVYVCACVSACECARVCVCINMRVRVYVRAYV